MAAASGRGAIGAVHTHFKAIARRVANAGDQRRAANLIAGSGDNDHRVVAVVERDAGPTLIADARDQSGPQSWPAVTSIATAVIAESSSPSLAL